MKQIRLLNKPSSNLFRKAVLLVSQKKSSPQPRYWDSAVSFMNFSFVRVLLLLAFVTFGASKSEAQLKIYYIRYAECGHNVKKAWEEKGIPGSEWPSYVGNPNVFTPRGEKEVIATTEKLQDYSFDFIATSNLAGTQHYSTLSQGYQADR